MGAIHTKVKLTNAIDEALVSRGMLAPHLLRECETEALVDKGATYLVIPADLVQKLGLRIRGQQKEKYADGREEMVRVTEASLIECEGRQTTKLL